MKKSYLLLVFTLLSVVTIAQTTTKTVDDTASYPYWIEMMQDQSINFYKTQSAFNKYWQGRKRSKGDGWKVFKRWEAFWGSRVDADGNFPPANQTYNAYKNMASGPLGSQGGAWTSLGPIDVPSNGTGQPNGIGRVNSVTVNPTNANEIWVGSPAGGLWKSTNAGSSWTAMTDNMPTLGVSDILIDSANTSTMYMGTGDRDAGDAPGMGVWKSTNSGQTWSASNNGMGNRTVGMLVMNPTNHNIILAATSSGVYRSTNAAASWTKTSSTANFKDIKLNPVNPNIVYASASGDFYRSTNGGTSFSQITSGLPTNGQRMVIGVSPANSNYVYAVVGNSNGLVGVYRSTNAGVSFSTMATSPNILGYQINGGGTGSQAWYDLDIAVDPTNINTLYVGGVNIWKSTNGGSSWSIVAHWIGSSTVPAVHADQHALVFNGTKLYAGCDGGLYYTANGGSSWTDISDGLAISQLYKFSQSHTNVNKLISGFQDNGTAIWSGANSWSTEIGGDGMNCIIDPTSTTYMYGALYYGDIRRSNNGGTSFSTIAKNGVNGINESGAWVTPYTLQSNNPNTMYAGYKNVWRSTNVKVSGASSVSWTKISNFGSTSTLRVIESCLADPNILYVGRGTTLYRTDNAQAASPTWTTLSTSGTIHDIETNPHNSSIVYVAAGNNVYKSTNKGSSWTAITGNLPNVSINCLVFDTTKTEAVYVGTDVGVFYRETGMSNWVNFSSGLPAAAEVTDVEIYYGSSNTSRLRVSTYGRGMWSSDLYAPANVPPVADFSTSTPNVCTNASAQFDDISSNNPTSWAWSVSPATYSFIAGTSASSQNPIIKFTATGSYTIQLIASNAYGSDTMIKNSYITVGTPTAVPFTENFETFTVGNPGTWTHGWTFSNTGVFNWRADNGGTPTTNSGPSVDHTLGTSAGKYLYTEASSPAVQGEVTNLISPCLAIPATGTISLSFWYHMYGGSITALHLDVFHNGAWINDIHTITGQQQTSSTSSWLNAVVPLTAYAGATVKFRFRVIRGASYDGDVAIDDFFVGVAGVPSADFSAVQTTTCTNGAINFYDATANAPTSWQWSATPTTISFVNGTSASSQHPVIKFNAAGTYSITLVAANNSGSDTMTKTNYITVQAPATLPFSENFESFVVGTPGTLGNNWTSSSVGTFPWTVDNGGTPSANTGPSVDHTLGTTAGKYLFTEASNPAAQGDVANLVTPCIDLSGANAGARLKFWYHMYGADITALRVDIYYNGSWINNIHTITGQQQSSSSAPWQQAVVSLNLYTGGSVKIRFRVIRGSNYQGDVAIDDVSVTAVAPPVNDDPCGAITITADSVCNYLTTNNNDATVSTGMPNPGCGGNTYQDVWFKVVAPVSGNLVIQGAQVVGNFADGAMAIYTGTCGNLSLLACNDDYNGSGNMPHLEPTGLTPGDTLFIRFWKYGGGYGSFKICAYEPPYFLLSPSTVSVGSAAGSATITASARASTSWSVSDNASWVTLSPASGSGNANITVNYSANAGGSRSATITGTSSGLPNQTVILTQTSNVVADYTLTNPYICSGTSVTFTNTSTNGNSYKWYLNGTQVSTQMNYSHTFTTQGSYVLKLVAYGTTVNDSVSKIIFVSNIPSANAGSDTSLCEHGTVAFNPNVITGIVTCNSGCSMPSTCVSASNNDGVEYIINVSLNGSSNSSTKSGVGYQDFTQSVLTPLLRDTVYLLQVTGYTGGNWKEYMDAYIDWNRNGLFDEPAISMGSATFNGTHVYNGYVTVPSNAVYGKTKMRIIMRYNAASTSGCQNAYSYGETEDYMIDVMGIDTLNYSWTGPASYSSNQVSPYITNILTSQSGTYNLTVTNGFGCSDDDSVSVTVNPAPNAGFAAIADVCAGSPSFTLTQGSPSGGTYSGTGVSGNTFNPTTAGVGTHWITYTVTNAGNCQDTAMQSITVNALPVVTFTGLPSSLCESSAAVTLSGNPTGGSFNGTGIINSNQFDAATAGLGTFAITYTYTDGNNCSDSASHSVTVNANPIAFAGNDTSINYGTTATLHASTSSSGSFNYAWSPASSVVNSTSATTSTIALTSSQQFSVLISNSTTSCSDSDQVMVSVVGGPLNVVTTASKDTICSGDSSQLLATASGGPGTYSYMWTSNPAGFTSTVMNPWVSPTVQTDYYVTVTSGSGPSASSYTDTITIYVNAAPNVSLSAFASLCDNSDTLLLTGGMPLGGTYSGYGVNNGIFDPQIAGVGTHNISYTYTNTNNCSATAVQSISVNAKPTVTLGNLPPVCGSSATVILNQGSPYGGTYSGTGVSGLTFNPQIAGVGTHTIIYTFTDGNNCTNSDTNSITVASSPTANAGVDQLINSGGSATLVGTASGGSGSYSYLWSPAALLTGTTTASVNTTALTSSSIFTFKVTDSQTNCADSDQVVVNVKGGPLSAIINVGKSPICFGDSTTLTALGSGGTGNYSYLWTSSPAGFTSTLSSPVVSPNVTTAYLLQLTDGVDTVNASSQFVVVDALPVITMPDDTSLCQSGVITLDAGGGYASYAWSDGSLQQTTQAVGANLPLGITMYYVTVKNTLGCSAYDSIAVDVKTNPYVDLGPDTTFCKQGVLVLDAGSGFSQYLWSTGANTQTLAINGSIGVGSYNYWVKVWSAPDCYSIDSIDVTVIDCDAIIENDNSYRIKIYPNPTENLVNVDIKGDINDQIRLTMYNMQGQLVYSRDVKYSASHKLIKINVSNLAKGVYTIRLQGKDLNRIEKLIVQ